ncbi:helix-turn-helix domain-containing protein [Fictibacillus halophilus]|uniref:helix-turn-helix domain-containing protein n=1 Tax=Fictibacillus halophilus TaxID=1610490 RepID=UPI003629210D
MENIGIFIRNERLKQNVSLRNLARETNITPSYISHVENGNIKTPSLEHVMKIFSALKVSPNYLVHFGYMKGDLDQHFIENELNRRSQKGEIQGLIKREINNFDRETLEATYMMITKYREIMMNMYRVNQQNERMPMTFVNDLLRFYQSEYASKS